MKERRVSPDKNCGVKGCPRPAEWIFYGSEPQASNVYRILAELFGGFNRDYYLTERCQLSLRMFCPQKG